MDINPDVNLEQAAFELGRARRLQIKHFLISEDAERVHRMLATTTPWGLVYNEGDQVFDVPANILSQMDPGNVEQIFGGVVERAQSQYQFVYASFPIVSHVCGPEDPKNPITSVLRFLNSGPVLDWFRTLTGRDDVRWIDAQATLYQSGHFLKSHSDLDEMNNRVAAYVMNFTKGWERDWGGYLQFFNDDHDIEYALRPIFNALNVFLVPIDHSVGIVAPFATEDRMSITGWLRTDAPPAAVADFLASEG